MKTYRVGVRCFNNETQQIVVRPGLRANDTVAFGKAKVYMVNIFSGSPAIRLVNVCNISLGWPPVKETTL